MHYLLRKQTIILIALIGISITGISQTELFRPNHDDLLYYFGLTIGYNQSSLHTSKSAKFLQDDSVMSVQPSAGGGLTLGLLATARLSDRFQIRFNPSLVIGGGKSFIYTLKYPPPYETSTIVKQTLPSTIASFPLQIKFNSDRIDNFRVYLLTGIKYDYDLSANSSLRRADNLIKLNQSDWGLEVGIGFNFFLRYVTLSPEIKFGYGMSNILKRDPSLLYSSVFDKIQSRMIVFSLHFED
ncbi:outer membrane beta-barrel protein [Chitinophagaceae bacterium LWZ2-11]